jgi:hypothetical protein
VPNRFVIYNKIWYLSALSDTIQISYDFVIVVLNYSVLKMIQKGNTSIDGRKRRN